MKKTLFTALIATFIGLFSTQAMACGGCKSGGQCSSCQQSAGKSCGCSGGSCKGE